MTRDRRPAWAKALRAYRYREDLNQAELAKRSGIPRGHLSEMERGLRPISELEAKKLARVLNCRPERLRGRE